MAVNEKQRELRELAVQGLDETLLASEKRQLNRQIAEGERELSQLERLAEREEAIYEAKQRVPPTETGKRAGGPGRSPQPSVAPAHADTRVYASDPKGEIGVWCWRGSQREV